MMPCPAGPFTSLEAAVFIDFGTKRRRPKRTVVEGQRTVGSVDFGYRGRRRPEPEPIATAGFQLGSFPSTVPTRRRGVGHRVRLCGRARPKRPLLTGGCSDRCRSSSLPSKASGFARGRRGHSRLCYRRPMGDSGLRVETRTSGIWQTNSVVLSAARPGAGLRSGVLPAGAGRARGAGAGPRAGRDGGVHARPLGPRGGLAPLPGRAGAGQRGARSSRCRERRDGARQPRPASRLRRPLVRAAAGTGGLAAARAGGRRRRAAACRGPRDRGAVRSRPQRRRARAVRRRGGPAAAG